MIKYLSTAKWIKIIKIAVGSSLAILLATMLSLKYAPSAGIIALLSIQETTKDTLSIAVKRAIAFLITVIIAFLCFGVLGYQTIAFGLFLLIFVGICMMTGLESAISMCAVLATHFLIEQSMSIELILNETMLMVIGAGIGILLNLFMPSYVRRIKDEQNWIETEIRLILKGVSAYLIDQTKTFQLTYDIKVLENQIEKALRYAFLEHSNTFQEETIYYIKYMEMRKSQSIVLDQLVKHTQQLQNLPTQAAKVSAFVEHILLSLRESNNAKGLLEELAQIRSDFQNEPLPQTRVEFEERAILIGLLLDIEQFLNIKRDFANGLTKRECKTYWDEGC